MKTQEAMQEYLERGVKTKTAQSDYSRLYKFAAVNETLEKIDYPIINRWLDELSKRMKQTSVNSYKQTLKNFFGWCKNRGWIETSPAACLTVKRRTSSRHKAANERDILKVINGLMERIPEGNLRDIRDLLAFQMAYDSGNRRGELVTISTRDMNYALRSSQTSTLGVIVYMTLAEGKIGTVPLRFTEYTAATYRLWQEVRPKRKSSHRVFIALAGKSPGEPMTPDGFTSIFVKRCQEFDVPIYRAHSFRHLKGTKISDMYSPRVAATVLGISVETAIQHYYNVNDQTVIDAIVA